MQMPQLSVVYVDRDEYDAAGPIPYNITSAHILFSKFFSSAKHGSHFILTTLYSSTFKKNKEGENREDSSCPRRLISFAITLHLLYPPQLGACTQYYCFSRYWSSVYMTYRHIHSDTMILWAEGVSS